ncbi:MAG: cytochrome P450, partial [Chloroflexota bacterium]
MFGITFNTTSTIKSSRPPGPKGMPVLGVLPQIFSNPLNTFMENAREYGDIVALPALHRVVYLLNHPDYIAHVLVNNSQNYRKGRALEATKPFVGNGLLTSEGDFHRRQRRLIQPAFHRRQVANFAETMTHLTATHIASWRVGESRDFHSEMTRLTMSIVVQTLFGSDIVAKNDRLVDSLDQLLTSFTFLDATPLGLRLSRLPTPRQLKRRALLRDLDQAIYEFIEQGENSQIDDNNLLSMLLAARDNQGDETGMSQRQIRDEVMTLFIAGHETTANAITWAFYLLDQHPEISDRLQGELSTVLQGRLPNFEDIPSLNYTRMVFSEAMRLYPPAWGIGRTAINDDTIGRYPIPAGSTVVVSPWVMHHHPDYWAQPEQFRPERFSPEQPKAPRYVYFPFG